jgi:redox-sensitive bicupin YhaK (pirin superfamily)
MTAGRGIIHEEFHSTEFGKKGGLFEMIQLWVNLPAAHKMTRPKYQSILKGDIPAVELPDENGQVRIMAGEYCGAKGPVRSRSILSISAVPHVVLLV